MINFKNIFRVIVFLIFNNCVQNASSQMVYRTISDNSIGLSDLDKKTNDFIEANGYIAEKHLVTTEDGYLLALHRIPGEKLDDIDIRSNDPTPISKPVVLFQHGIAAGSDIWLLNGKKTLPYMLADLGFDVWLSNTRGNSYARKHINMTDRDPEFWNFSFHEQGYYDLAANIDYVLSTTDQDNLIYIGHSRGTTMGFALLSTRPEYNDRIRLMINLAPVAYIKHSRSPVVQSFLTHANPKNIETITRRARVYNLPGLSSMMVRLRYQLCRDEAATQDLCLRFIFLTSGFDNELMNRTMLPVYYAHWPDGGSLKEYLHYLQIGEYDRFQQFDYGAANNLRIYGQPQPPLYDFQKINVPIALYYSDNDYFVSMEDFTHLAEQLNGRIVQSYRIPFKKFNHIDFVWGTKADVLVYKPLIDFLLSYLNG